MKRKLTQTIFGMATVALVFTITAEFKRMPPRRQS